MKVIYIMKRKILISIIFTIIFAIAPIFIFKVKVVAGNKGYTNVYENSKEINSNIENTKVKN